MPLVLTLAVSACNGDAAETPPGTVGAVPPPPTPETLLPLVTNTSVVVDDTATVPADTLFGGDPCAALTEAELRGAASQVPPSGTDPTLPADETGASVTAATTVDTVDGGPVSTVAVSGDACQFRVTDPVRYSVLVRVTTVFEYETPDATADDGTELEIVAIPGVGVEAKGIDWGDHFEVLVKVTDGWFVLEAPDRVTAARLAGDAADRCCD